MKKVVGSAKGLFSKPLGIVLLVVLAFTVGNAVGDGRLSLSRGGNYSVAGLPEKLDYSSVDEVYKALRTSYDGKLTEAQVIDGLKDGLAESTKDPYTEFFTASEAKDFQGQLNNSFSGIGAELGKDADDNLIVVSPISGFPADKAGLRAQDVIATIDGESTSGLSIDDAVSKIRGQKGTTVKLQIIRNKTDPLSLSIVRDTIKIPSVDSKELDGAIGYVNIRTFSDDTGQLMNETADKFVTDKVKTIILDLRGDPGGLLDQAISVAGQWLPSGKTVLVEKRGTVVMRTDTSDGPAKLAGIPTIVLIDEGSASASEIVAGALHDNGAARLMGVKSYGKGVVQNIQPLSDGSELKVTVASWYRPNGQNINKKGITPDDEVKISEDDIKAGTDTQKDAAIQYLLKK